MRAPSLDWICIFLGFGTLTLRFSVTILISSAWSSNGDCLIRSFTSVTKKTLRGARIQIVVKLLTLPYVSVYALHSHAQNVFAWADSFGASHEEDHKYPNRRASLAKVFGSAQRKPCLSLHQFELSTGCAESTRSKGSKLAAVERLILSPVLCPESWKTRSRECIKYVLTCNSWCFHDRQTYELDPSQLCLNRQESVCIFIISKQKAKNWWRYCLVWLHQCWRDAGMSSCQTRF